MSKLNKTQIAVILYPKINRTHEQLLQAASETFANTDIGNMTEIDKALLVFKYVCFVAMSEIIPYDPLEDDFDLSYQIAANFLFCRYERIFGTEQCDIMILLAGIEIINKLRDRLMVKKHEVPNDSGYAIEHVFIISQEYKNSILLNCASECENYKNCKQDIPKNCEFLNAVCNISGAQNITKKPRLEHKILQMEISNKVFENSDMAKKLHGVIRYFNTR